MLVLLVLVLVLVLVPVVQMGGAQDAGAVVDPRLRVYGLQRLRIADCSVVPQIVNANTNAIACMIGEKVRSRSSPPHALPRTLSRALPRTLSRARAAAAD